MENKLPISEGQVNRHTHCLFLLYPFTVEHHMTDIWNLMVLICTLLSLRFESSSLGLKLLVKVVFLVEESQQVCHVILVSHVIFQTSILLAETSATYEQCCVLFNIGALQSQIAKAQNFDSDEGLKNAAKHFQVCACVCACNGSSVSGLMFFRVLLELSNFYKSKSLLIFKQLLLLICLLKAPLLLRD